MNILTHSLWNVALLALSEMALAAIPSQAQRLTPGVPSVPQSRPLAPLAPKTASITSELTGRDDGSLAPRNDSVVTARVWFGASQSRCLRHEAGAFLSRE